MHHDHTKSNVAKSSLPWSPQLSAVTYLPSVKFKGPHRVGFVKTPYEMVRRPSPPCIPHPLARPSPLISHNLRLI